jgi:hypothetical protein
MLHRMSSLIVAALTALALVACSENQALAWGNEGHRLVCQIALDRLTPAGQAFLDSVRALESDIEDPFEDCQSCSPNHPSDGRTMSFSRAASGLTSHGATPSKTPTSTTSSTRRKPLGTST